MIILWASGTLAKLQMGWARLMIKMTETIEIMLKGFISDELWLFCRSIIGDVVDYVE